VFVHAAVKALVLRDGKMLVITGRVGDYKYADFPGGKIKHGESPLQALEREVREETSLRVVDPKVVGVLYFFRHVDGQEIVATVFECKGEGEVELADVEGEILDSFEWMTPQEFLEADLELHESYKQVVRKRFGL
jgi:8-oxo-dGTP pyrophosphatase MutT (NUDIX family)